MKNANDPSNCITSEKRLNTKTPLDYSLNKSVKEDHIPQHCTEKITRISPCPQTH